MKNKQYFKYFQLVLGSILFALSINLFIVPCKINAGGVVGIAQIFNHLIPISRDITGILNFCLNIPLFVLGITGISKDFCLKTLLSIIVQTICLSLIPIPSIPIMPDVLSNCIIGAVLCGVGVGMCLLSSGSAGGTDILGVYLTQKNSDFSVGKLNYFINFIVLGVSAFLFDLQIALYSIIFIVIMYGVCDRVHYQNINMLAIVFTQNEQSKKEIIKKLGRGVTYLDGRGAYRESEQEILLSCISKYEARQFKKLINNVDPKAFVILVEANPVQGNFEKRL